MVALKVHHLNLCTMCPYGGRLIAGGTDPIWKPAPLVIHTLLVETKNDGLVLVDTGFGLADMRDPKGRLGASFELTARPELLEQNTAIRQIEALGHSPKDVRHIVVTHLDLDHAGGLSDFPDADVHVHRVEQQSAIARASMLEKERYKEIHFAHEPRWKLHEPLGDKWNGFDSVRAISDDILLIPLHGHTRGHCGVAVNDDRGWLLHCGDAYFVSTEIETPPRTTWGLGLYQRMIAMDDRARMENQRRLAQLKKSSPNIRMFCAHSPHDFARLSTRSSS